MVMQTCLMRISIHTSAREVTAVWVYQVRNGCEFQSTLPQGKWLISFPSFPMIYIFQSTLPQGKWLMQVIKEHIAEKFQSTLPQGKWRCCNKSLQWLLQEFQSTLPQGKWHKQTGHPTQGLLFQSTLPQGKWRWRHWLKKILIYFNPHFRKGSDDYLISSEWLSKNISIHTSAREVTWQRNAW